MLMTPTDAPNAPPANNSWSFHYKASLALGFPFIGAQLAQLAINTTDVVIVGKLGASELAAVILATQMLFTVFIFGSGFANAVVPLAAQAVGRGDGVSVRRSVRMGMWAVLIYGVVTAPVLWWSEALLLAAGQQPDVAALAQTYLRVAQWSVFPSLIFMVLRAFLSAFERAGIILYVTIATLIFNGLVCYVLTYGEFGFPALGIVGAAWASLGAGLLGLGLTMWYIAGRPQLNQHALFVRFWRPDWTALRDVFLLGFPIAITVLAEVSLFTAASLLMGTIGTVELAAHGIALQFASIAFMVPLGLAQAATVRVGLAYGRRDRLGIYRAAISVLVLSAGFSTIGSIIFALFPSFLASLYLDTARPDSAAVLAYAGPLIIIAGAFQLIDGMQVIGAGLLRGLKDTKVPMILALVSYWAIGFLFAWVLAFPLGFGGLGVWYGFVVGLLAAAILLNWRFFRLLARPGRLAF